jgi:mono/diheme cytochrome c family protein
MDKALPSWLVVPGITLALLASELRLGGAVIADGWTSGSDVVASSLLSRSSATDLAGVAQAPSPPQPVTGRQSNSEPARSGAVTTEPRRASTFPAAVIQVYRTSCLQCHDTDGRGEVGRDLEPNIPNFTLPQWQSSRTDVELSRSILQGKGKSMPRMKTKLGSVDVKLMVAFVRAFRGGNQVVDEEPEAPSTPGQPSGTENPKNEGPRVHVPSPPGQKELSVREGNRVFQRSCVACHGADGKGSSMRDDLPTIPDFTARDWQQRRGDPQLVVSIMDGKGTGMPAFRDKIARERIRDLVTFIRTFAPGATRSSGSTSDDFEVRFNQLSKEFEELDRQIRALSAPGPGNASAPPTSGSRN